MKHRSVLLALMLPLLGGATTALAPTAAAAPAAVPPGQVCFWTEVGMHGQAWCYGPPGYADAENGTARHAVSFDSRVAGTVYAISYTATGCLYREIRRDDYSENWEWAGKLDGVSDTTMGCEPG
ncbi:hypothetical protein [Streptomyces sp. NPDC051684]|uniref:hypothetical protein n=1 Tax=Streptomyces sp. NPDC051684 TaxID=3365670 RepID=UPI0037921114